MRRVESARWSRQLTLRRREIGVVSQHFPPVSVVRKPPSAQKRGKRCVMSRRVQNQRQIKRDCGKGRRKMKTKELDCVPLYYNKFSLKNRLVIYVSFYKETNFSNSRRPPVTLAVLCTEQYNNRILGTNSSGCEIRSITFVHE